VNALNWGTLHKCDFENANLLILQSGATPCEYSDQDVAAVDRFLWAGGGVLVLGDFARFRTDTDYKLNALARSFGAEFVDEVAVRPLRQFGSAIELAANDSRIIRLANSADWRTLADDARGRVAGARRNWGMGQLVVASRGLVGRDPVTPDNINLEFWHEVLRDLSRGKSTDASRPPKDADPDLTIEKDGLTIEHTEYLAPIAEAVFGIYGRVCPTIEQLLGVPKSSGMLSVLRLLPTDGGGYSGGNRIGIGVFWGNFPDDDFEMIELIAHEATHSWVLPYPEPMWNEGIATYVGILANAALGNTERADDRLREYLAKAERGDPKMSRADLAKENGVSHDVRMSKPMWIWEQLRAERSDILSRYFRAKRSLVKPGSCSSYSASDAVAVLSRALGRSVFPWFRELGIDVDERRTRISTDGTDL
jgi:hypothetical protein